MSGTSRLPPGDNPYQILGISPKASDAEITRAYRRLVRQHHPDTAPGHTALDHHRLDQVFAAYQHLRRTRNAGSDSHGLNGTAVPITVHHHDQPRPAHNESWNGSEPQPRGGVGSGRRRIPIAHRGIDTTAAVTITTDQARTGLVVTVAATEDPVEERRLRNIRVRIPPGTRDGQTLRSPGHGHPGINGGPPGDLHLTVYHATTSTP